MNKPADAQTEIEAIQAMFAVKGGGTWETMAVPFDEDMTYEVAKRLNGLVHIYPDRHRKPAGWAPCKHQSRCD